MPIELTGLDHEMLALLGIAFERAWDFVKHDHKLAHCEPHELRTRLASHLLTLVREGEKDLLAIANAAIRLLRQHHAPDASTLQRAA